MIIEEITVTAFQQHTRILGCEQTKRAISIDPGDESDAIVAAIDKHGFELQAIAVTHAHLDHIGGVSALKKIKPAAAIMLHKADEFIYEALPEQAAFPVSSPITLFNGARKNGNPTLFAHAHLEQPVPATFVVPVVIEKIDKGIYGYRTSARIPPIANGAGIPVSGSLRIGRKWTHRGESHSYVNARCETGRLQARAEFSFDDGTRLNGTFLRPCQVR